MSAPLRRAVAYLRELLRAPEPAPVAFRYRDLAHFWPYVKPVWRLGALGLLLILAGSAVGTVLPLSSKVLIDFVALQREPSGVLRALQALGLGATAGTAQRALASLNTVVLALLALSAFGGAVELARRYLLVRFQEEVTFNLQTAVFEHVLRFPIGAFREKQTGYLMARISEDVHALQALFTQQGTQILTSVFYLVFGLAIAFALSVRLALIALAFLPFYVLANYLLAGRVRSRTREVMERRALVSRHVQEALAGVDVVKSFSGEQQEARKVAGRLRQVVRARIDSLMLASLAGNVLHGVQVVSGLALTWFGVRELQAGRLSVGSYVAFNAYVIYLAGPVQTLATLHLAVQPALASLERLLEILRTRTEFAPGASGTGRPDPVRGEAEFAGVGFEYERGQPVLAAVSFTVRAGEVVALVGPSGAGKTTLANLLLGFYAPAAGCVRLDGHDLRELDLGWLRSRVGYVPQEGFLFADSLRNNIRYGNPEADDEAVVRAAQAANIHDEIAALPQGYETVAGERGTRLSVGQKQRVAIARAFLKNPPVLVLDEPTSALDAASEALLKDSLRRLVKGRTTFIIAHRLSFLDFADRILVLDAGRLVEQGPHAELMARDGLYRRLYTSQMRG
jgi:subfamily B ATP-binding cassette protein MsbA